MIPFSVSPPYNYSIKRLLEVAGYDVRKTSDYQAGLAALVEATSLAGSLYPEDIVARFIDKARAAGRFSAFSNTQFNAVKEILRGGIFNDAGVESYAKPCAPLALGLMELAAQAAVGHKATRFFLASADISNLGGLNEEFPDNRAGVDRLLQHLAQKPTELLKAWAKENDYQLESILLRTGGDEFKSVCRVRRNDGAPIKATEFADSLKTVGSDINRKIDHFSNVEHGMGAIPHLKKERAPGVTNTVALRALDPAKPEIAASLHEMEADIAKMRKKPAARRTAPTATESGAPHFPDSPPPSHHALATTNPYADSTLELHTDESLDQHSLRAALGKAGFADLANEHALFPYNPQRRFCMLDKNHAMYQALSDTEKNIVARVQKAEELRGVIDPVTRTFSPAFRGAFEEVAKKQQFNPYISFNFHNLAGMNRLGESMGDAVLRDIGGILENAYIKTFADPQPGVAKRPPILHVSGGEFMALTPPGASRSQLRQFIHTVEKSISLLNKTPLADYAEPRKLILPNPHPRTLGKIQNTKNSTTGLIFKSSGGILDEHRQNNPGETAHFPREIFPAATTPQFIR